MQIVIDIDDNLYTRLFDNFDIDVPDMLNACAVIRKGTPLPKGHGRLIDVSNLLTVTDIREDGSEFTYVPYFEIEDAPTIIEADEEERSGEE